MTENTKPTLHLAGPREGGRSLDDLLDRYRHPTGRVPEGVAMDTLVAERELKKDLRIISNSFTYFALRVQAAERIEASHRTLATDLAESQHMNKLQLEHIAELEKQLATVTEERDLLRTMIINAAGILTPYVNDFAQLIRASTHVTQKLATVQELLKAKWSAGTPIPKAHDASPDQ